MTKAENVAPAESKAQKKSGTRQHGQHKEKAKPPTKIIIRHLPPTMTEEEFLKQIDPLPPHDAYYFAAADWSLGFDATCRAYLTLKNYDDVFLFRDRFDGYVFVDAKGAEYAAIVEFAPFQGLLKNKSRRSDNKENSIEEESHYQQFLTKLEEEREAAAKGGESKLEFDLNTKKEEITSTPLLQYLAHKKEKRREEAKRRTEEKRRQREGEKEKRRQIAQPQAKQQVTRIISAGQGASKRERADQPKESGSTADNNGANGDEEKQARARRRADRNQRRREAYAQRKANEQREKATNDVEEPAKEPKSFPQDTNPEQKTKDGKEGKQFNDKRERDRERQRARRLEREREREKQKEANKGASKESMRNLAKNENNENRTPSGEKLCSSAADEQHRIQRQRSAEERRIRNKDRPSIAIYQPKARLRVSEESDNGGGRVGSRSNSDCESKPERLKEAPRSEEEQQRPKKVSRYSERRNERRAAAKEKQKTALSVSASTGTKDSANPEENDH